MKKLFVILTIICASVIARADKPATHGMLLFGGLETYTSHLPMFHAPHDYQLITKVTLSDIPRSQTLKIYEYWKSQGETLFTLVPEKMDLTQVIDGTIKEYQAVIFLGHFEKDGKQLGGVKVTVDTILLSEKLQPIAKTYGGVYFVFGKQGEYYAAHVINGKGSFDSILQVEKPWMNSVCTRVECSVAKPINDANLPIEVASYTKEPMKDGQYFSDLHMFQVKVIKNIYTDFADLAH